MTIKAKQVASAAGMAKLTPGLHIGTSGWSYEHWRGPFYPEDLPSAEFLPFYARHFHSVEINTTFYHLPTSQAVEHWHEVVPEGFIYAVKASRYLTHVKRLKDTAGGIGKFFETIAGLAEKTGPVLFQLPPRWHVNIERLAMFVAALPREHRYVFEFRDQSWHVPEVYDVLRHHGIAFCIFDLAGVLSPRVVTTDFVYVRLHGPGSAYAGKYHPATLRRWAREFQRWRAEGRTVYCYFDNDEAGYAAQNALALQALLV